MQMHPNPLVQYLQKPASAFTRDDIVRYIEEREIEMLNFRYVAEDGKLKTINFMITGREELEMLLSSGERVDGSSIFSHLSPNESDLYLVPRYKTAFLNPFSPVSAVDILCSFYSADGKPLESSPEYILRKAQHQFQKATGMSVKMMAELEYYVIGDVLDEKSDLVKGFHSAESFSNNEHLRVEALKLIARCGGKVRFGHTESGHFILDGKDYEQHEIEFSPIDPEDAADQLVVAKWILRMLGQKYHVNVTFIPKISLNQSGSGLHFHFKVEQDGKNMLVEKGELTSTTLKMISGILDVAPALTAFGNTIPVSYLRLMSGQRAPLHICWGMRNRSTLVRVPLGWDERNELAAHANQQESVPVDYSSRQTIEYRGADGSANPYLFSAALIVGMLKGLTDSEAVKKADSLNTGENLFRTEQGESGQEFEKLPVSCADSADRLEEARDIFESDQIFPKSIIDHTIAHLRSFNDKDWSTNFRTSGENQDFRELVEKYMHYM